MKKLDRKLMMKATMTRDSAFDGIFYVGVKTTGIYCLPSCKAKKPFPKNIVFFKNREDAKKAGLRGCNRCKSESFPDVEPKWFKSVVIYLQNERSRKASEKRLTAFAGVNISTIRRHFKNRFNTTVMAFHRRLRLERAKEILKNGSGYLDAAFDCGYESLSGFRNAFIKVFGNPPRRNKCKTK